MGGWKASGLGSRHGPDGIRKYTKRQSLMVTPGYAPSRDAHHFPYSAQVEPDDRRDVRRAGDQQLFDDRAAATLSALCDTFIPALDPPAGRGGRARLLGACRQQSLRSPEGVEVALIQAELTEEQVIGLRALLDGSPRRDVEDDAARAARADRPWVLATRAPRRSPG